MGTNRARRALLGGRGSLGTNVTPPAAPSNLVATSSYLFSGRVDLTWTDNASDETAFSIERSPAGAGTWAEVATPAANATSAAITGMADDTSYDFRIRANKSGVYSSYSATATAKTTAVTAAPLSNFYHVTQNGVTGALTTDGVDYSRDMADLVPAASFRAYEFKFFATSKQMSFGFDVGNNLYDSLPFEFQFHTDGSFSVKESGVSKATGTYLTSDAFRLIIAGGVVYYAKNGVLVWTSLTAPGVNAGLLKLSMSTNPGSNQITSLGNLISQN